MNFKKQQLESKIKLLLSEIILEEVNNETLSKNTSIIDVKLNNDFSKADVYVGFITKNNDVEEIKKLFSLLQKETALVRTFLSKKISTRVVPTLEFKLDHLVDDINKLEKIIEDINIKENNNNNKK